MRSLRDLCAIPTRSVRDLRDLLAICSRSARDLHATCAIWARSGRDLGAICVRSCLEPWCVRLSAGRRILPNVAEVADCLRLLPSAKSLLPTKVTQQSYQKVCFEHFGSGLECCRSDGTRSGRDLDAIWTRSGRDLHAICVRSARDLLAISMRSACDLCAIWCDLMRHQCDVTRH